MKMSVTISVTDFENAQFVKQTVSNILHNDMDSIISYMNLNLVAFESLGVSLHCPVGTIRAGNSLDCGKLNEQYNVCKLYTFDLYAQV